MTVHGLGFGEPSVTTFSSLDRSEQKLESAPPLSRGLSARDHPRCRAMALSQSHRVRTPANGCCQKTNRRWLADESAARSAPCGDHDLGEPSRARRRWAYWRQRVVHKRDEEPHRAEP